METAEFSAAVCVAEPPSPEAASSTEHVLSLVHLSHGSTEAEGWVPTFCKMPLQPDPDLLLFSQAVSTENFFVSNRFLLYLPRKKEITTSSLYPGHWVLQSVKQPQSAGRRVCGQGSLGSWVCLPHPLGEWKEHPSPAFCARLQTICPALLVGPYISHHWFFQHLPLNGVCMGMQVKLQQLFSLYLQNSTCPAKTPNERIEEKILY